MRAATAIVGAIAVASILIALAFVLSSGGSSGTTVVTKTVIEKIEPRGAESPKEESPGQQEGGAQFGGPTPCGKELSVENTSCEIGEQIHTDYEGGKRGDLFAKDEETGETITVLCEEATSPVTCSSEDGAVVYFEP